MPAASIAAGRSRWVDSAPGDALLNAAVDIGKMRQVDGELEGTLRWPATPASPGVSVEVARVICTPQRDISYTLSHWKEGPGGIRVAAQTFVASTERKVAEAAATGDADMNGITPSYSPNPRSLLCWAAARKCEGKPFTWPPPPNKAPLDTSEEAAKLRREYNALFFPKCKLGS